MRTTKEVATISFNSDQYLIDRLDDLVKVGKISFWAFIKHKPEDDEGGKKEHIHLYLQPSKMIQTDDLKEHFKEYDPEHPQTPKTTISFVSSKFDHWYMYAIHDRAYLAQKGQERRYHYNYDDLVVSDPDELLYRVKSIDIMGLSPYQSMIDAMTHGVTWAEWFARGTVPIPQVHLFERAWHALAQFYVEGYEEETNRNGRAGHK